MKTSWHEDAFCISGVSRDKLAATTFLNTFLCIRQLCLDDIPDSKLHGANMGPTWGRQDPGGPHVGHVNLIIWDLFPRIQLIISQYWLDDPSPGALKVYFKRYIYIYIYIYASLHLGYLSLLSIYSADICHFLPNELYSKIDLNVLWKALVKVKCQFKKELVICQNSQCFSMLFSMILKCTNCQLGDHDDAMSWQRFLHY